MSAGFLFDLPRNFFEQAVVTDGEFDPEKAEALGYSEAQYLAIIEFLGLDSKDTQPLKPTEEE